MRKEEVFVKQDEEEEKVPEEDQSEELILVHDDLIDKDAFYDKYNLFDKLK